MSIFSRMDRRWRIAAGIGAALLVVLFLRVDDWGRDLTQNTAEIGKNATDPGLEPLLTERSSDEMVDALRWGARRIGGWEYVGQSRDGDTTRVVFVRVSRIFRLREDVTMRILDRGRRRVITGESASRLGIGDLGQNPRNLKRLLEETRAVLDGARRGPLT